MDIEDFLGCCLALGVAILLGWVIYSAVTTPSCEELGGRSEFSHMLPVYTGKTVVYVPHYNCIISENKDANQNSRSP